ncbi:phosphotransferase [Streptomyces sp. CA-251247]|uniref:phosphotransferase n=1 Tax=Streptomyces sp. CA-251247 TaxID=3240062 RepID=UPI003D8AB0CD
MTVDAASEIRRRAAALSSDGQDVEGPLEGYHHEAYAFRLPVENPLAAHSLRGKLRVPRPGLLWFDRRCFASEDRLLIALQGRVSRIPESAEIADGVFLQGFIEGRTLGGGATSPRSLAARHVTQLGRLFRELTAIKPDELDDIPRVPTLTGSSSVDGDSVDSDSADDDSAGFLRGLIRFTEHEVYRRNAGVFGTLLSTLGVREQAWAELSESASGLGRRPFVLLHGDLHRKNLIVDPSGDLWFIDWELAMIGDPLYDLATHLHLMHYTKREEQQICEVWREAVEYAKPGCSAHMGHDLPVLMAYKRVQSVITDVIRTAEEIRAASEADEQALPDAARKVRRVLAAAQEQLGLTSVPSLHRVMAAYADWLESSPRPHPEQHP